jgi:hypothetical protein
MERKQASNFEPPWQTGTMTEQVRRELPTKEIGADEVETGAEDGAPSTAPFMYPSVLDIEALMVGTNGTFIQLRTASEEIHSARKWTILAASNLLIHSDLRILASSAATVSWP